MGNKQQRSGQPIRETRERRSFNPNSSRKMKASSLSPTPYQPDNTMEKQRIPKSGVNIDNSLLASQNQRFGNATKMRDQQQYQQQSLKESQTSKLNKSNNIARSYTQKQSKQGSNELVLNKYELKNQPQKSKNNSQSGLILSKYYDGNLIDEKAIHDISISHLNQTVRNDLSMDSYQEKQKNYKGFASTAMSQRLGMRRHSDNTLATVQQQIELSIKSRQGQERKWKKQEELMNTSEFMAEYRLFEGFFAGKEQSLAQTSFITINMDLLEPFQEPSRGKGEMRQTFGPQQRDLDLQRYLQFLTDLESNSIESMDYRQLTKEKKRNDMNFSSRFKGVNNNQGFNPFSTNQTMNLQSSKPQVEQAKREQIPNYIFNEDKPSQKGFSEKLDSDSQRFQRFEQSNQQVLAKENTNSLKELPQKELVKDIGKTQQDSFKSGSQQLRDLSDLQKKLFEKSSQKLKEDQYSYDPRQTVETLGQDTHEQAAATKEEWDHLCQELMGDDQLFEDKSVEEIIEERKEMGSKGQIFSEKNVIDNPKNLLSNQQGFSNVSSIVVNDNQLQDNKQNQNIPRQLAQPIREQAQSLRELAQPIKEQTQQSRVQTLPSGRNLSEKSLVKAATKEEIVNISEIESNQENTVFKKQDDDERGMLHQNSKLYQQKSAEFPHFSQSQSEESLSTHIAPFQNHFLPNFQYQNNNKTQPIQDPFSKTQINKSLNAQQSMPFRYLQKIEQSKQQEAAKPAERPLAGRKAKNDQQVDDEIARKQMEIQQLDKRIGVVKETNEEAARQRQERAQEKLNKSRTGVLTPNQSVIMNNTQIDRTLPSPRSARDQQNSKGNVSPNYNSKYQGVYMNANQYSNQHKKKRELQVDSYSQMLFPSHVPPTESFILSNRTQQEQQIYQDTSYQPEMGGVMQLNRHILKEDEEQKNQNIQMYYNSKKEILKTMKHKQYTPMNNPQQNHLIEEKQQPLSARTYQDMVSSNKNQLNQQFNDFEDASSHENEGFEENLQNINQQLQSQPIEVKMNLQDFRKNSKVKVEQEEVAAREVIPIEIDIKQFIKKRSSNANNDKNKIVNSTTTMVGVKSDNQRKAEIEEIGLKKLVLDRNNSESEGETILKSISRQVISLKGRIEKDQKVLDQNNISYQNKIVTQAINTLDNSYQNNAEDRHGSSLQQIPDFNPYEHPQFLSHQPSKHNIQYQQQQSQQKQIHQVSSTKDLKYQQIDSPSQFEQVPQGFGTVLENEESQFSTIPSNYNPYLNTNNLPVTQFQLSKDQQNIQTFPTEEDENKRYPMTSQFEVASLADQEHENQGGYNQQEDSQDSMHFFESQPAQFSTYQKQPFMDQNLQRTQQPPKNTTKNLIASSTSSLHDGFGPYSNLLEQKGIRSVPSNNSLITSKRASIQSAQSQQLSLGGQSSQNKPIASNSPHMSTASRHSNQASNFASKKNSIQGDDFKTREQQYLNKVGSNSEQNMIGSRQQIGSSRQNQQSASSLQSNKYLKDNGNAINSARSSESNKYFNQDIQFRPNGNINYEDNNDYYSSKNNQNRQSNHSGDGFDFSAFNSAEQNEDHYSASDVDSEDDNEPAKIKIDLNLFKKK